MRDHAEVNDVVYWPTDDLYNCWTVASIIECQDGSRYLAISHGETEADIVTRVVPEREVVSNAFLATGKGER